MTFHDCSTISSDRLQRRQDTMRRWMDRLGKRMDALERAGQYPGEQYAILDATYDVLFDLREVEPS